MNICNFKISSISWAIGPIALLVLWNWIADAAIFSPTLLPRPLEAFGKLFSLIVSGDILPDLYQTLWRTFVGYAAACLIGTFFGIFIGSFRPVYQSLEFLVDFFRSLPVTTLYPLFVLFFGIGSASKIAMVFAASVFVVLLNAAYGVIRSAPTRRAMARLYGASGLRVFFSITLPEALPQALIGMRIALSYSLIVAIVTEMFMGAQTGLGQRVFEAYSTYATAELYAIVLITGMVGYALNQLFVFFERGSVGWAVQ